VAAATVANRANPAHPELQDFGDMLLRTSGATGCVRVDWLTPDGLPYLGRRAAGDRRYQRHDRNAEVRHRRRKGYRSSIPDHSVQRIDCSYVDLPYGRQLVQDVLHRTESAMPQARCFKAMELALTAQAMAEGRA
jgi:hypothetical protein